MAVLAPDIQDSLGVSSAVLGAIGGAFGVLFVMGGIPIAALADRRRRTPIAGACTLAYGLLSIATAAVGNAFWLFVARMGSGLAASHILPVHNSLLADAYPIKARGRIFSIYGLGLPIGQLVGPVAVGGIASLAGGVEGWRWAFVAVGVPVAGVGAVRGARDASRPRAPTSRSPCSARPSRSSAARCRSRRPSRSPASRRSARSASCSSASGRSASACSACPSSSTSSWRTRSG